ncbi:hypothetical protein HPP92_009299 [Vanilla planifolia]|uniref:Uncharacterized protein n=1 Tax=Vanilla planifolia TaxID=51239 RepID=A0A835RA16_VANPL|nr:hypothetical protein HPP92_009299 [Vanilla planifolia]
MPRVLSVFFGTFVSEQVPFFWSYEGIPDGFTLKESSDQPALGPTVPATFMGLHENEREDVSNPVVTTVRTTAKKHVRF